MCDSMVDFFVQIFSLMAAHIRNYVLPILAFIILQVGVFLSGPLAYMQFLNILALVGMLFFLFQKTKLKGRFHKRVFLGLVISLIGCIFFAVKAGRNQTLFPSMLFYVLPQVYLISAFYLDFRSAPELDKKGARITIVFAFFMSLGYYMAIRAQLGILKLPVMIGLFTSSLMFMMACFRNMRVNSYSFRTTLVGVLLYILAEGLFAYHSFANPIGGVDLIYAVSLMSGLYLVVLGTVSRKLLRTEAA